MSYSLNFQEENGYLKVEVSGDRRQGGPTHNAKAMWQEVVAKCLETGLTHILMISKVTGSYPTIDAYKVSSSLEDSGVHKDWIVAYVCLDPDSMPMLQFATDVAYNRGYNGKLFSDEKKAREWLNERILKSDRAVNK